MNIDTLIAAAFYALPFVAGGIVLATTGNSLAAILVIPAVFIHLVALVGANGGGAEA